MIQTLVLIGMLTVYREPFYWQQTRCGLWYTPKSTMKGIAVDIDHYGWRCGDIVGIQVNEIVRHARVWDSGPLHKYCVQLETECPEIVGDLPDQMWLWDPDISVRAVIWNESAARRLLEVER